MLAGNWGTVGGGVLMNSILDMLTLRGLWEMSAGSLNTNLEFWGGGQRVGTVHWIYYYYILYSNRSHAEETEEQTAASY